MALAKVLAKALAGMVERDAAKKAALEVYHGSPVAGLRELRASDRGPLGPGVYFSPNSNVAQRYGSNLYKHKIDPGEIFHGAGKSTLGPDENMYEIWRQQAARLNAVAGEHAPAISARMEKLWPEDGYRFFADLAHMTGSKEQAQALLQRAGYQGIAGHVDGPEIAMFGNQALAQPPGIRAYHGSPYKFDKFDLGKVGTGEGAAAFGHGLYFAEREGIARSYRDALQSTSRAYNTFDGRRITPAYLEQLKRSPELHVADFFNFQLPPSLQGTSKEAKPWIMDRIAASQDKALDYTKRAKELRQGMAGNADGSRIIASTYTPEYFEQSAKTHEAFLPQWRDLHNRFDHVPAQKKGAMYEVNLETDPNNLLDWDAGLSGQSPEVLQALQPLDMEHGPFNLNDQGKSMYRTIGSRARSGDESRQAAATKVLRDAGIPGIKYRDNTARLSDEAQKIADAHGGVEQALPVAQERLAAAQNTFGAGDDRNYWQRITGELSKPQTRNFVMFDPELVKIVRRYALPVAAGAGAGATGLVGTTAFSRPQQQPQY